MRDFPLPEQKNKAAFKKYRKSRKIGLTERKSCDRMITPLLRGYSVRPFFGAARKPREVHNDRYNGGVNK
jgi:hypothetical protein